MKNSRFDEGRVSSQPLHLQSGEAVCANTVMSSSFIELDYNLLNRCGNVDREWKKVGFKTIAGSLDVSIGPPQHHFKVRFTISRIEPNRNIGFVIRRTSNEFTDILS